MHHYSNARLLTAAVATLALAAAAPFAGCGGDEIAFSSTATSTGAGGGDGGSGGAGGGETLNCNIDGVVTPPEQCDDGNDQPGDGCENDCSFTCTKGTPQGDARCDDGDLCNGVETCTDAHTCAAGTALDEGTPCADGKVCKSGICGDVTCGDSAVTPPEECDDGNVVDGDGCDSCAFSCLASDPLRDCSQGDPCQGEGTCDDGAHVCTFGAPPAEGTACGASAYCKGGACTVTECGNDDLEPGEACDDGNPFDGDGCDVDCTLSCVNPLADCAAAPQCLKASCSAAATCALVADAAQNGVSCGAGLFCNDGACIGAGATCGNGIVELGEDCDFGAANAAGSGCEITCKYSCTLAPDSCPDADVCNGVESCKIVLVNNKAGQKCSPGVAAAACSGCTGNGVCIGGSCKISHCGDACLNAATGEQCEPPGSAMCNAACHLSGICGDGVRDPAEQCDDGNTDALDGCDAACKFEQDQRAIYLRMQFASDAYCTANGLGGAMTGVAAQNQLQTALDDGIQDGSIAVLFKMLGLDDLSGTSDPSVQMGVVTGTPAIGGAYDGTNDLDWWHDVDVASVDANGNPVALLPGSISAKTLTAGPGSLTLNVSLGGSQAALRMTAVNYTTSIGSTSKPLASAGATPGHLASEHLDPALVSYGTMGQKTLNGSGKLCGNVSALSLSLVPIPASLTGGGLLACSQGYTVDNTMLDLIVGGCTVLFIQQIKPTQPDKYDPAAPAAGAGASYKLSTNAQKVVSTCKDVNNAVVDLETCLNAAAYSSFFKVATGRVILK